MQKRSKPVVTVAASSLFMLIPHIALASNFSGGSGGNLSFVTAVKNLANACELIGPGIIIISLFVIVGGHMMERQDMGSLMQRSMYAVIAGAVLLAGGAFFNQVGLTTAAGLLY